MNNIFFVDFKVVDRFKLLFEGLDLKVSDGHFLLVRMLVFDCVWWMGVIGFVWFLIVFAWRINIAEDLVDIMDNDGF